MQRVAPTGLQQAETSDQSTSLLRRFVEHFNANNIRRVLGLERKTDMETEKKVATQSAHSCGAGAGLRYNSSGTVNGLVVVSSVFAFISGALTSYEIFIGVATGSLPNWTESKCMGGSCGHTVQIASGPEVLLIYASVFTISMLAAYGASKLGPIRSVGTPHRESKIRGGSSVLDQAGFDRDGNPGFGSGHGYGPGGDLIQKSFDRQMSDNAQRESEYYNK